MGGSSSSASDSIRVSKSEEFEVSEIVRFERSDNLGRPLPRFFGGFSEVRIFGESFGKTLGRPIVLGMKVSTGERAGELIANRDVLGRVNRRTFDSILLSKGII